MTKYTNYPLRDRGRSYWRQANNDFGYGAMGRLTVRTDPLLNATQYFYDKVGNLVKTIDGNGNEIEFEYETTCPTCSGSASSQPSRVNFPTFSKEFEYDSRYRRTAVSDVLSDTESVTTRFTYDMSGNLISKTDRESKSTRYEYDDLDRLAKVIDSINGEIRYVYDNRGNLTSLTDAKDQTTWFEYDRNNRLTKEIRPMGEETRYTYDSAGNLIEKIDAKNQKTEYGEMNLDN